MDGNDDEQCGDLRTFSEPKVEDEFQKGVSVGNQLLIWDMLLETRIKLQKLLVSVNKLPQCDVWSKFQENEPLFEKSVESTSNELCTLLNSLLHLSKFIKVRNESREELNDDDIPSEDENDVVTNGDRCDEDTDESSRKRKKLKYSDYESEVSVFDQELKSIRNNVIDEWYERTRYATASKSNKASLDMFEQSTVKAIEQVLLNRNRLVKRTQLKRSLYEILGKSEATENKNDEDDNETIGNNNENYDAEIFDDDDFYHQLLRELIESKTEKAADPIALSRKWLQIQRIRSKLKRKVDTKASKGRKIRYDVHSKLINFMAPCDELKFTDDAKNELFASLFGKRKYLREQ